MTPANAVVVSGAGSGIGRAVAVRLAADGFHVIAVGRRRNPLDRLAGEMEGSVDAVPADVATEAGAAAVAAHLRSAARRCAGVVAAAGGLSPDGAPAAGLAGIRAQWQASFESNVLTAVLLAEALRDAINRDGGRIVLISSVAALRGSGGGPYGAMKAALHGWVYDLARDLGPHGGTANVVAPGFVPDTESTRKHPGGQIHPRADDSGRTRAYGDQCPPAASVGEVGEAACTHSGSPSAVPGSSSGSTGSRQPPAARRASAAGGVHG